MTVTAPVPDAQIINPALIKTDMDLCLRFASPNVEIEEVCASAYESGDKVVMALSASPLERREEGLKNWRKRQVSELLRNGPAEVRAYLDSIEESLRADVEAGKYGLGDLDQLAAQHHKEKEERKAAAISESKAGLKATLVKALEDSDEESSGFHCPSCLLMSSNGEVKLFKKLGNAVAYGLASKERHLIMRTDPASISLRVGSEVE
ncbi:MAG: hypothetical protein Q7R22_003305 [Verrucomicrobiota bacterium JB025]|nr:hypothetical protein [Verrucomicrobiota bacterium JB025]